MIDKSKWVWMPHAGHWILGSRCRFHLNTYVGKYIVSTVGECPKSGTDWRATSEFETVGAGPECYETMVFKAIESTDSCCPYRQISGEDVDCKRYMTAEEAVAGHMMLCEEYASEVTE